MLKLAIKNSLIEKENSTTKLEIIEEMKTYYPTAEEFDNPVAYVEKLYSEGAHKFGTIKIVPPNGFKPRLAFNMFSD